MVCRHQTVWIEDYRSWVKFIARGARLEDRYEWKDEGKHIANLKRIRDRGEMSVVDSQGIM
jgi:hypothetical protein